MLWASWTTLVPTLLVSCAVLSWWFSEPKTVHLNLIVAIGCILFCWAVAPELTRDFPASLYAYLRTAIHEYQFDRVLLRNATMIVTSAALLWLLRRAVQTLWKPVPELISILGVEVPDPPDVSLTAIGVDKATVAWTRPQANRPVQKFLIQVNGVNVGESATNQDTFITVSGLKPDHFYNVRVIAVGSNNFQAGSRVIRLRTFGTDGRPQLGTSRLPSSFSAEDLPSRPGDQSDEPTSKGQVTTIATPIPAETTAALAREGSAPSTAGSRRNTINRKHSPSTTSLDRQSIKEEGDDPSEAQMAELNQKYLGLRRETEETAALIAKEEEDNKRLLDELEAEKKGRRREQKKKEEQTEKLKREQGTTDRTMRNALQRKAQKEKLLKERQAELAKYHDNVAKWEKGIVDMRKEQESYVEQKDVLEEERNEKVESLREANQDLQQECARLEQELKERRQQVKELEDARKKLPGGEEDSETREKNLELRRDWQRREMGYREMIIHENRREIHLDRHINALSAQLQQIPQSTFGMYNQANSSGIDFDSASHNQIKRRSHNSNSLSNANVSSPPQLFSMAELPTFNTTTRTAAPGFAPGPFMGLSADLQSEAEEAGLRALLGDAPLSPTATSLLPSNIFADDEPPSPTAGKLQISPFIPSISPDNEPQSPASSGPALSILSSPQGSAHNLPFSQRAGDASERGSLRGSLRGPMSSPIAPPGETLPPKFGFLSSLQRTRTGKGIDEGPALGSLKAGQSQSFPRQGDEGEGAKRRISLSSWNMFNRNSTGPELIEGQVSQPSRGFSARSLLPFGTRATSGIFSERDPSSPRPASIASSELPRPSTDSNSIWGPPGDSMGLPKPSRLWSPDNAWSRNPSRRPSIHGSPSALKTNLASAEDEILDDDALLDPQASPSQVGVIGSRPPAGMKALPKSLNPTAPTFMTNLFRPKTDKDKEGGRDKEKSKGKEKSKDRLKEKGKGNDASLTPTLSVDESPSDSRKSRDGYSVHTQTSVSVSESRESLSLDQSLSNTPSESNNGLGYSAKDPENAFRKLFRKDSTSKLSFSQRLRKGKGPGSVTNSEKNMAADRSSIGDMDEGDEIVLGRSYDSVTSSPSLAPSKSKEKVESKLKSSGSWFGIKKKPKEKESLEMERERSVDADAEEDKKSQA
ncbi:uncharacterized protein E0L32_003363 [Thyridium curvatum]|uniref:Fibronectin type-III domain-containing protein n=1 Tax=Thyridium curvatum TaxID=1093900 RepID=A0A507B297_9PEZI|nr:uncharacterized protein E0L32_003363 [Thyridium curvatum]TPX17245.1 hypothetical protein E0L32_003363 [Thyridium curvatum]